MSVEDLLPGAEVRVKADDEHGVYACRVASREDDGLVLAVRRGPSALPAAQVRVRLAWTRQASHLGTPVTEVEAVVLAVGAEPPTLRVRPVGPPVRIQRRDFVRMVTAIVSELVVDGEAHRIAVINLSEGGAGCIARLPRAVEPDECLVLSFTVGEYPVVADCRVLRADLDDDGRSELALAFVDLPDTAADRIRSHLFAEERRLLAARRL